jgi:hypothetical protein
VQTVLASLHTINDLANLVLTIEVVSLQTHTQSAARMRGSDPRKTALSIAPIEAGHASLLQSVLGTNVDPKGGFVKTDQAADVDSLNG